MQIFKGNIITVDKNNHITKYLVEDSGRIIYTGDELPSEYKGHNIIDLGEKTLMPAFADTHSHFASYAMLATTVKLDKAKSNAEVLRILQKADTEYPVGKTLLCFGASPKVEEGKLIEKKDIDGVVKHRTVVIICGDGHTAILNENALKRMPKKLTTVRGYDYDTGIMHQEAFYETTSSLLRVIDKKDALQAFQDAIDLYIQSGVGLICAQCASGFPLDIDVELLKWIYRGQTNGVQMRLFIQSFNIRKALKRNIGRLGGCFETALDGSITSQDAALLEPYNGTDKKGVLYYTDEELFNHLDKVNRAGLQIQMHAIGDAAVEQGTRVLKKVLDEYPRPDHRHGLIHVSLITPNAMKILQDYGIQVIGQPAFIEFSEPNFKFMHAMLGDRVFLAEPHSEFVKRGINFCASSDAPVTFPNPISWIHWMVNNPNNPHKLTLTEAIRICTYNGYWSTFDEKERGSLEKGKIADMIVLNKNPYATDLKQFKEIIKVEKTYLGGKEFVKSDRNILACILSGMIKRNVKL